MLIMVVNLYQLQVSLITFLHQENSAKLLLIHSTPSSI